MAKSSSVTKRHILGGMDKAFGIVFTPHQWQHSDRKYPLRTQFQKPIIDQMCKWAYYSSESGKRKKMSISPFWGGVGVKSFLPRYIKQPRPIWYTPLSICLWMCTCICVYFCRVLVHNCLGWAYLVLISLAAVLTPSTMRQAHHKMGNWNLKKS